MTGKYLIGIIRFILLFIVLLMICYYYKPGSARTGSDFAPYTLHSEWSGRTNLKFWIGFNAGLKIDMIL